MDVEPTSASPPHPDLRGCVFRPLGWAGIIDEGRHLIARGQIRLRSNHDLGTVSPMAGVVRPSQTVMRIEDRAGPGVTYATLAKAGRQVLRMLSSCEYT